MFGYASVEITGPDGRRSHVERRLLEAETEVIRRIFRMCADGAGYPRIARALNDEGAASPRSQQGRPAGWATSSVREVLFRPLYRGEIVWNKTRKRDQWGQHHSADRAAGEWIHVPAPTLRIVSDDLWESAHTRLQLVREKYLTATSGPVYGRPRDVESKYLLPGFARCASCGGGLHVRTRQHGRRRQPFYACTSYYNKGKSVCQNGLEIQMERADDAVLASIGGQALSPAVCDAVVAGVLKGLQPASVAPERARLEQELATVEAECGRLVLAIATAGDIALLIDSLRERQAGQARLKGANAAESPGPTCANPIRNARSRV